MKKKKQAQVQFKVGQNTQTTFQANRPIQTSIVFLFFFFFSAWIRVRTLDHWPIPTHTRWCFVVVVVGFFSSPSSGSSRMPRLSSPGLLGIKFSRLTHPYKDRKREETPLPKTINTQTPDWDKKEGKKKKKKKKKKKNKNKTKSKCIYIKFPCVFRY